MAFLGSTFDATQVEPNTPFEVVPAGKYHVQIVRSEMRDTKTGSGQYLWMELAIIEGPYAERRLFERLNLVNPNAQAVVIAQRTLSAICRATDQLSVTDSEQLHHRSMIANVRVRPAGPDKNNIHREASNEIAGYEALGARPPSPASSAQPPTGAGGGQAEAQAPGGAGKAASTPPWKRPVAA